jgi:hypothetical protein
MNRGVLSQLDKVLALADSNHDGEATAAVRKARQMLSRGGLSFGDLARAAAEKPRTSSTFGMLSGRQLNLETELTQLRQRLDSLQAQMQTQDTEVKYWRRHSGELEQKLNAVTTDAGRWRQLARDTIEKLWDLSLAVQQHDLIATENTAKTA